MNLWNSTNLEPYHDLPFNVEMTEDKNNKVVQLAPNGKKPFLGKDKHTIDFLPFRDSKYPTGINCNYYQEYKKFLCVLDIDDPLKYESEMYSNLEFKDSFTRESKNGLHIYFWSKDPLKLASNFTKKDGTKLKTDYRGCTAANPDSWGHHVRYYNEFESNCMEVEVVDINEIVEDFLVKNDCIVKLQGEHSNNLGLTTEMNDNIEISPLADALALFFHYKMLKENPLWEDQYTPAFTLGMKLAGYLKNKENAQGFCKKLMSICAYDKEKQWIRNFLNGFDVSDFRCANNFGGEPLSKNDVFQYQMMDLSIEEYAKRLCRNTLHSYLNVVRFKI